MQRQQQPPPTTAAAAATATAVTAAATAAADAALGRVRCLRVADDQDLLSALDCLGQRLLAGVEVRAWRKTPCRFSPMYTHGRWRTYHHHHCALHPHTRTCTHHKKEHRDLRLLVVDSIRGPLAPILAQPGGPNGASVLPCI